MSSIEEIETYCSQYQQENGSNFLAISATINGYHNYRIRPLVGFQIILNCIREPNNPHDTNAVKVVVPVMRQLREFSDLVIRENPRQTVEDIAGKTVGRVPAVVSATLSPNIDAKIVTRVYCVYVGSMRHGNSALGDGPKLNCIYFVHPYNEGLKERLLQSNEFACHIVLKRDVNLVLF